MVGLMDTPKRVLCTATWARGVEVCWWKWTWDEEHKVYIEPDSGVAMSPSYILAVSAVKQLEGWQLCRAVV